MIYEVSANGTIFGLYQGYDEQAARDACARDAGYSSEDDMVDRLEEPSGLEARLICGDTHHLPRPYCTQPRKIGDTCWGCSLVNYQRDCMNNPVAPPPDGSIT